MNTEKSEKLYSRALDFMPGGVNSPVRAYRNVGRSPLFIDRAYADRIISTMYARGGLTFSVTPFRL